MLESKFSSKVQFLSESKPKNVGRSRNFSIKNYTFDEKFDSNNGVFVYFKK